MRTRRGTAGRNSHVEERRNAGCNARSVA
jgi:hypothetical protein